MVAVYVKDKNSFNIFYVIFKFWQSIYVGVLGISNVFYAVSLILPIVFAFLGYLAGTKNFEFAEKYIYPIIFKNKKRNKS